LIGLTAEYKLRPDWEHPRLKSHLEEFKARHSQPTTSFGSLIYFHFNNPQVRQPSIPPLMTPFGEIEISLPIFIQSLELDQSVCNMNLILFFFKTPIDAEKFRYMGPGIKSNEDLKIELQNPCKLDLMFLPINKSLESSKGMTPKRYDMDYYMDSGKVRYLDFRVFQFKIDPTSEDWRSNSKISSIFDILDAQMIVQLTSSGYPIHPELSKKEIENLRKSVKISELVLRIPNGIVLSFDNDNLSEHVGEEGYRYYSFNFPDNMEDMLRATKYNMFKQSPDPNLPNTP